MLLKEREGRLGGLKIQGFSFCKAKGKRQKAKGKRQKAKGKRQKGNEHLVGLIQNYE